MVVPDANIGRAIIFVLHSGRRATVCPDELRFLYGVFATAQDLRPWL